jgi:hypothetical protein
MSQKPLLAVLTYRQSRKTPTMPLGFQRLNERVRRPNEFINFIRPLPGEDEAKSKDFLERVAAIVYPIMKANYLAVMALEEFPPNREFWGRNFNAGEVIQLVLKSLDGRWLPFRQVQMVMIHELAHVKEMNHSRFFWRVRNVYAGELKGMWQKGYTGEGFWGTGQGLDGSFLTNQMPESTMIPSSLCGGTYKRRRKRKTPADAQERKVLRAEQKQKRILKKFGPGGMPLGADENERLKLENGKNLTRKSRVAASARARELRAAAALSRLEKSKPEEAKQVQDDQDTSSVESDASMTEWEEDLELHNEDRKLLNSEGKDLVRICDGGIENDDARRERDELLVANGWDKSPADNERNSRFPENIVHTSETKASIDQPTSPITGKYNELKSTKDEANNAVNMTVTQGNPIIRARRPTRVCIACSFENQDHAIVCVACANVLDPGAMPNHWKCQTDVCKDGAYLNIGDYGRCQICGSRKPEDN